MRAPATRATGSISSLVCRIPAHYPAVAAQVTAERVAQIFAARKPPRVVRYDLPRLAAFNFVLDDVLEGGVNASTRPRRPRQVAVVPGARYDGRDRRPTSRVFARGKQNRSV